MSALVGKVVEVYGTIQTLEDDDPSDPGMVHAVVLDGWIVDSLEPRYLLGILEPGEVTSEKKSVDGVQSFRVGTLLSVSHRDFGMAPAPEEARGVRDSVLSPKGRRTFKPGEGWN